MCPLTIHSKCCSTQTPSLWVWVARNVYLKILIAEERAKYAVRMVYKSGINKRVISKVSLWFPVKIKALWCNVVRGACILILYCNVIMYNNINNNNGPFSMTVMTCFNDHQYREFHQHRDIFLYSHKKNERTFITLTLYYVTFVPNYK